MTTGKHVVRDLRCVACGHLLGWRYELAHERREKYKEGKYILERMQLVDLDAAVNAGLSPGSSGGEPLLLAGFPFLSEAEAEAGGEDYAAMTGPGREFRAYGRLPNHETALLLGDLPSFTLPF